MLHGNDITATIIVVLICGCDRSITTVNLSTLYILPEGIVFAVVPQDITGAAVLQGIAGAVVPQGIVFAVLPKGIDVAVVI